jgi:hypothetical protein
MATPTANHARAGARTRLSSQAAEAPESAMSGHSNQLAPRSAAAVGIQGAIKAMPAQWIKQRNERQGARNAVLPPDEPA